MKSLNITVLDISTQHIRALCGSKDLKTGEIKIIAKAEAPCFGVRAGEITKPEQVALAIEGVIAELNKQTNWKIKEVVANISGSHIFAVSSQGLVSVARADQHISYDDVQRALKAAQVVNLPLNKEVLEVFPQEFIVDGEAGIKDPIGLAGIRLEVKAILACLFSPVLENLEKAIARANLQLVDVEVAPLACSRAVLTQEQKELGVLLLEIGSGATSCAVFEKGVLKDFVIFPVGSANITNDIAIGFRTEIQTAERLKIDYGFLAAAKKSPAAKTKEKPAPKADITLGIEFSQKFLNNIIQARVNEILDEVSKAMKKYLVSQSLPGGIVFCGAGALLPGLADYCRAKFKLPCRLGHSREFPGISAIQWACCLGLLLGVFEEEKNPVQAVQFSHSSGLKEKIKRIVKSFLP